MQEAEEETYLDPGVESLNILENFFKLFKDSKMSIAKLENF